MLAASLDSVPMSLEETESAGVDAVMSGGMPWFFGSQFVSKFSGETGTTRFSRWLLQIEAFLRAQTLQPQQAVDFLLSTLDGQAHREAALLPPASRATPQQLIKALEEKYGDQRSPDTLQEQFFGCRQLEDEDSEAFALRLRERLHKWRASDPDWRGDEDKKLRAQFSKGLRDGAIKRELQRHLRRTPQATFSEICKETKLIEKEEQGAAGNGMTCQAAATAAQRATGGEAVPPGTLQQLRDSLRAELQQDLREQVVLLGKTIAEELRGQLQIQGGAAAADAPNRPAIRRRQNFAPKEARSHRWDEQGRPICSDCGGVGHIQRFCPRRSAGPQDFAPARSLQGE